MTNMFAGSDGPAFYVFYHICHGAGGVEMKIEAKKDLRRLITVVLASLLMAINIKTFVRTGGLGWCDGTDDPDPAYQPDVSAT